MVPWPPLGCISTLRVHAHYCAPLFEMIMNAEQRFTPGAPGLDHAATPDGIEAVLLPLLMPKFPNLAPLQGRFGQWPAA